MRWGAGILCLLVGVISWFFFRSTPAPKRVFDADFPMAVEASPVDVRPLRKEVSVAGSVRAYQRVTLKSETQGTVSQILFKTGDYVQKDQPLIELDHQRLDVQLREAQAKLALARSMYEKEDFLLKNNAGKKISHTEALQQMKVAEAQVQLIQHEIKRCTLTAPFEGYTSLHDINPGTFITPNMDLLTIVNTQKISVDFRVPEQYLSLFQQGTEITVQSDQNPSESQTATIQAIDPYVDPVTHSAQVRAEMSQTSDTLRPGLFVRVTLPLQEVPKAIMIPEACLQREGNEEYVMRLVQDRAFKTLVTIGLRKEGMVEITDGLTAEDQVVTSGHQRLRDGQKVKIVNQEAPASSPSSES